MHSVNKQPMIIWEASQKVKSRGLSSLLCNTSVLLIRGEKRDSRLLCECCIILLVLIHMDATEHIGNYCLSISSKFHYFHEVKNIVKIQDNKLYVRLKFYLYKIYGRLDYFKVLLIQLFIDIQYLLCNKVIIIMLRRYFSNNFTVHSSVCLFMKSLLQILHGTAG